MNGDDFPYYDFQWARSELVIIYPDFWPKTPGFLGMGYQKGVKRCEKWDFAIKEGFSQWIGMDSGMSTWWRTTHGS